MKEERLSTPGSRRNRVREALLQPGHFPERHALAGFGDPLNHAGILHRGKKPLGIPIKRKPVKARVPAATAIVRVRCPQHPLEGLSVKRDNGLESLLRDPVERTPRGFRVLWAQQTRREHRRQSQVKRKPRSEW